jgi:hypothetical protein
MTDLPHPPAFLLTGGRESLPYHVDVLSPARSLDGTSTNPPTEFSGRTDPSYHMWTCHAERV